ncbi:MAG: hypothetical protein Q27BB25_09645 [Blastomonas sp. CACIA14H2]|uniref:hypothetical protein n=1 Tax=Blastomonas sp. CACIA14H2 TaxID=1419876 RepID=UPI0003CFE536|nr:MAG: hypothetical protein Q27BB25_09645 [Blastomonas sp. CACIA14H2]
MFPKLKLRRSIIFGCSSLLVLPALSSAQDAPTAKPEIEVLGERQTEAEARRDAHDYVRKTGIVRNDDPVARWNAPICPKVIGLHDDYGRIVEDRVRGLAQRVGVKAADAPCRTNIIISFVTDARATARRVASRNPVTFNEVPQHARDALINGDAPVRWWYSTALGSSDGVSVAPQISGPEALGAGSEQSGWLLGVPGVRGFRPSVVQTQIVRSLQSATVIVDINRAQGLPLDSVADYAATVALAEVQPGDPPTDSLLALFASGGSQAKLTDFDLSFLKGLYDIPASRAGWQQRRMLVARIIRDAGEAGRIIASP